MKSLKTIFRYLRNYKEHIGLYFGFSVLASFFSVVSLALLSPFLSLLFQSGGSTVAKESPENSLSSFNPINLVKEWLNGFMGTDQGKQKALLYICLIVFAAIVLKNLFGYLSNYFLTPMRNRLINDMRLRMYDKILKLPIGYYSEQRKGDIINKMSNDINEIETSTLSVLETLLKEPLTIIFYFVYLLILSPQLTLFLVLFIPMAGFILGRIGKSLKKQNIQVLEQFGNIFSTIEETLGGIRVLKAFNAEGQMSKKFKDENDYLYHYKNAANRRRDLASPVSEALGVTAVLVVLFYGGRMVLSSHQSFKLDASDFLTYIAIFSQLISPLKAMSVMSYNVQRGAGSIERVEALINEPVTIKDSENAEQLTSFKNDIEFKNVSLQYGEQYILRNINLKIEKGQTIALVGSSGAGKSTLADLIPRFIDPTAGEVLIDGKNIKDYTLASIRAQMGIVTQEAILFNDTIANNIAFGSSHATPEMIENAAKVANAHAYISTKENGYETNIGERGSKLSGGERQRLTIARAVFKNPPILILDEATSALDTESERLVQDAINNLMENRTSLVIAHRLATVRHADLILVMKEGEIVERGSHEDLMQQSGIYQRLVQMQEVK